MRLSLFRDTVETRVSPFRYRVEKAAHVALLGLLATLTGLPLFAGLAIAGACYAAAGVILALPVLRVDDKLRDAVLCFVPALVVLRPVTGVVLGIGALLVPVRD